MSTVEKTVERTPRMTERRRRVGGLAALALGLGALAWVPTAVAGPAEPRLDEPVALDGYGIAVSAEEVVLGDTLTVTVSAEDVTDLYAYDLTLEFDPEALEYVEGSAATELTGATYGLEEDGTLEVVHTKLGTSPSATGAVTLASVTFTATEVGPVSVSASSLETVTTDRVATTTADVGTVPVEVAAKAAPVATTAPRVTGTATVGRKLTATGGAWSHEDVAVSHQWTRGGKPISGATGTTYRLRPADARRVVAVVVSAAKPDHVTGTATASAGKVARAVTQTRIRVPTQVRPGARPTATVRVAAAGITPTGAVKVTYGGKVVRKVRLKGGAVEVVLPARAAGRYLLKVRYLPADGFTASSSTIGVRVVR